MPWSAIIPALGTAVGAIGGAEIAAGASENAAQKQADAAKQAAQLQEQALQLKAQEYNNALKLAQQQWAANQNIRAGLLKRYGVTIPSTDLSGAGAGVTPISLAGLTALPGASAVPQGGSGINPAAVAAAGVGGLSLASLWRNGLPSDNQPTPPGVQIPLAGPMATAQPVVAPDGTGGVTAGNGPTLADLTQMFPAGAFS